MQISCDAVLGLEAGLVLASVEKVRVGLRVRVRIRVKIEIKDRASRRASVF